MKFTNQLITLLFISIFTSLSVNAQKPLATFFSEDGYNFTVIMDGKKINSVPMSRVEYVEMDHDWAKVKVIFEDKDLPSVEKTIQGKDADGNISSVTWVVKQNKKGKWKIAASSWKPIEEEADVTAYSESSEEVYYVEPDEDVEVEVQSRSDVSSGSTVITTQTVTTETEQSVNSNADGFNMKIDINDGETSADLDINVSIPGVAVSGTESHQSTTVITTTTTTNEVTEEAPVEEIEYQESFESSTGYSGNSNCDYPMSDDRFDNVMNSISSKDFEDTRLTVAKQVMKSNCLYVSQVKQIMGLFDFEDTKLDFAKAAYNYTHDLDNYYEVNDEFTFESSIEELNEFINR